MTAQKLSQLSAVLGADLVDSDLLYVVTGAGSRKIAKSELENAIHAHGLPSGGSSAQVLAKSSGTSFDVGWVDEGSGSPTDLLPIAKITAATPLDGLPGLYAPDSGAPEDGAYVQMSFADSTANWAWGSFDVDGSPVTRLIGGGGPGGTAQVQVADPFGGVAYLQAAGDGTYVGIIAHPSPGQGANYLLRIENVTSDVIFGVTQDGGIGGVTPNPDDVISWNGTKWVAAAPTGGGGADFSASFKPTGATPLGDPGLFAPTSTDPVDGGWVDVDMVAGHAVWTWGAQADDSFQSYIFGGTDHAAMGVYTDGSDLGGADLRFDADNGTVVEIIAHSNAGVSTQPSSMLRVLAAGNGSVLEAHQGDTAVNELHRYVVSSGGSATGGSYDLGSVTINRGDNQAAVQAAFDVVFLAGQTTVTGNWSDFVVEYTGTLALFAFPLLPATSSLTGPDAPYTIAAYETRVGGYPPTIGVLGASASPRQVTPTTLDEIVAVLATFGFCDKAVA